MSLVINKDCTPNLFFSKRVALPPAKWLEAVKDVNCPVVWVNHALQSMLALAEAKCSEIRPPKIECICFYGPPTEPTYDSYDKETGDGVGKPTGRTAPIMGFYVEVAGVKKGA